MHVNWLDIAAAILLVSSGVAGFFRGLARELAGLLGLLLGILLAVRHHEQLALAMGSGFGHSGWGRVLAFIVIMGATWVAAEVIGRLVAKSLDLGGARWFDRIAGGLFGVARGFVTVGAALILLSDYAPGLDLPTDSSTLGRPAISAVRKAAAVLWRGMESRTWETMSKGERNAR